MKQFFFISWPWGLLAGMVGGILLASAHPRCGMIVAVALTVLAGGCFLLAAVSGRSNWERAAWMLICLVLGGAWGWINVSADRGQIAASLDAARQLPRQGTITLVGVRLCSEAGAGCGGGMKIYDTKVCLPVRVEAWRDERGSLHYLGSGSGASESTGTPRDFCWLWVQIPVALLSEGDSQPWYLEGQMPLEGQRWNLEGSWQPWQARDLLTGFDAGQHYGAQGLGGCFLVSDWERFGCGRCDDGVSAVLAGWRAFIVRRVTRCLEPRCAGLLLGLTLGSQAYLDAETRRQFVKVGVGHLLAASGLHMGCVLGLVWWLGRRLGRPKRRLAGLALLAVWIYASLTAFSPSITRAALMASLFILALVCARRVGAWRVLVLAALAALIWRPLWIWKTGFWLSFTAVAGLLLWGPLLSRLWGGLLPLGLVLPADRPPGWRRILRLGGSRLLTALGASLAVSVAVMISLTPILGQVFGEWPWISIGANLVSVPLAELALPWALAGCLLPGEALACYPLQVASWLLQGLLSVVEFLSACASPWMWVLWPVWGLACYYALWLLAPWIFRALPPWRQALCSLMLVAVLALALTGWAGFNGASAQRERLQLRLASYQGQTFALILPPPGRDGRRPRAYCLCGALRDTANPFEEKMNQLVRRLGAEKCRFLYLRSQTPKLTYKPGEREDIFMVQGALGEHGTQGGRRSWQLRAGAGLAVLRVDRLLWRFSGDQRPSPALCRAVPWSHAQVVLEGNALPPYLEELPRICLAWRWARQPLPQNSVLRAVYGKSWHAGGPDYRSSCAERAASKAAPLPGWCGTIGGADFANLCEGALIWEEGRGWRRWTGDV